MNDFLELKRLVRQLGYCSYANLRVWRGLECGDNFTQWGYWMQGKGRPVFLGEHIDDAINKVETLIYEFKYATI